jgi:hypothetical protein
LRGRHFERVEMKCIRDLASGAIRLGCAAVNQFRYLLAALLALSLNACARHHPPKSNAQIYEGDKSPGIRMFDEAEKPGSAVGQ